jgi:hypothetical protein
MLLFLANIIEQLDLAVEHLEKGDAYNARFALMLSDNAIELMLHGISEGLLVAIPTSLPFNVH